MKKLILFTLLLVTLINFGALNVLAQSDEIEEDLSVDEYGNSIEEYIDNELPEEFSQATSTPLSEIPVTPIDNTLLQKEGVVNDVKAVQCFSYYNPQSVVISMGPTKENYRYGDGVTLVGSITNNNSYAINDGAILIRIGRRADVFGQGNEQLTEFYYPETIKLKSGETKSLEWTWSIPAGLQSGEYEIQSFFLIDRQFQISGMPFTNEVIGSAAIFNIESDDFTQVHFLRDESLVNNKKYTHIGEWPYVKKGESFTVKQFLKNPTDKLVSIPVKITTYRWSGPDEESVIDRKTVSVEVPANGVKEVEYILPEVSESIYYITMQTEAEAGSFIATRVLSDISQPRMAFANNFPNQNDLTTGSYITCLHNMTEDETQAKLELILRDGGGQVVGRMEHPNLNLAGNPMGLAIDYSGVDITKGLQTEINVYSYGRLVDSYKQNLTCEDVAGIDVCNQLMSAKNVVEDADGNLGLKISIILILLMVVIWFIFKRQKQDTNLEMVEDMPIGLLILGLIWFGALMPNSVEASYNQKTATASTIITAGQYNGTSQWYVNFSVSLLHRIGMTSGNYNNVVGDEINFLYHPDDPFFNVTSSAQWCPYGYWIPPTGTWVNYTTPYIAKFIKVYNTRTMGCVSYPNCESRELFDLNQKYLTNNGISATLSSVVPRDWYRSDYTYLISGGIANCTYSNGYPNPKCGWSNNEKSSPTPETSDGGKTWNGNTYFDKSSRRISVINSHFSFYSGTFYPYVSITSNNPAVVSCSGVKCVANSVGSATLTANITSSKSTIYFSNSYLGASDYPIGYGDLSAQTMSWDVTVAGSLAPAIGSCGLATTISHLDAPIINLCGVDNAASGVSNGGATWNWNCTGNNGGNTVACVAPRIVPPQPKLIVCPDNVTVNVGQSQNLEARYWADNPAEPDCSSAGWSNVTTLATWNSLQASIASVNNGASKGQITGESGGSATINASYSGLTSSRPVNVVAIPSVSLSGSACSIQIGNNTCTTNDIDWTFTNAVAPYSVRNTTNNYLIGIAVTGNNASALLKAGPNNLRAIDNAGNQQNLSLTANCVSGASIHPVTGVCADTPDPFTVTISATPKTVRRGNPSKVDIDVTSTSNLNCNLYGASTNPVSFQFNATNGQFTGISVPYTTKPLKNTQNVYVKCTVDGFSSVEDDGTVTIEVEGDIQEI